MPQKEAMGKSTLWSPTSPFWRQNADWKAWIGIPYAEKSARRLGKKFFTPKKSTRRPEKFFLGQKSWLGSSKKFFHFKKVDSKAWKIFFEVKKSTWKPEKVFFGQKSQLGSSKKDFCTKKVDLEAPCSPARAKKSSSEPCGTPSSSSKGYFTPLRKAVYSSRRNGIPQSFPTFVVKSY